MPPSRKNRPVRAATLADVGRAAGVSAMAASVVLNGAQTSSRIAPETRERIVAAAVRLHYRPNAAARALANRRMDTLGVAAVVDGGDFNHYFLGIFNGILEAATRHQQNTTVFTLHDWSRDATRLHEWCDGRIDGMILVAPTLAPAAARLLPAHTPFVAIHSNDDLPGVVNVETDEERGALEMTRHLVAQGHRRILHLAGPAGFLGPERRVRGYRQGLRQARLAFDPALLAYTDYSVTGGRDAMRTWLKAHAGEPLPHAVFGASDAIAMGAIEALAETGLRVPDDISVAGFDDSLLARTVVPQLTTVRQPLRMMAKRAVEVLLRRIADPTGPRPESPIVFPVDLVPRASVGAPPVIGRLVPAWR